MGIRDNLKARIKTRYKTVTITSDDEPDLELQVRSISELERTEIVQQASNGNAANVNALLIAACACNEEQRRIYSDSEQDLQEILSMDSRVTTQLSNAINEHIVPPDVEELVKNSSKTPEGSLQSDSPTS